MTHLYYGDGKGKTTAAMGLVLRWVGRGGRAVVAQFLKGADSGERVALEAFPNVTLLPVPETMPFLWNMTPEERENPQILGASRKKRIAAGCGLDVVDVNRLLKQFEGMQQIIKQVTGGRKPGFGFGGLGHGRGLRKRKKK